MIALSNKETNVLSNKVMNELQNTKYMTVL